MNQKEMNQDVYKTDLLLMYLFNTFSICFCWNLPLITKRWLPSIDPDVPNSANKYCITWSG